MEGGIPVDCHRARAVGISIRSGGFGPRAMRFQQAVTTASRSVGRKECTYMKLFARQKLTDEEHRRCLAYHEEQLKVAVFLCREGSLLEGVLAAHWDAITKSPASAGEVCRAADRFRQAAEETLRRHAAIQSVPGEASRFYDALSAYFSYISAWTKVNLTIMETLAQGKPPFYVSSERLKDHARSAWGQAQETYRAFRRRIGLSADQVDALETALHTRDFEEARIDEWQSEPYTRKFTEIPNSILSPQDDGPQTTADTMKHRPTVSINFATNGNTDSQNEAPQIDCKDAAAWFNEGCGLAASDRHEQAANCYDKALSIDPQDAAAWFNKGVSLAALGRYEEAIACYDQALAIDPLDWTAWFNKGVNLAALGRRQEAVECFGQAVTIDPQDETAWCAKGVNLAALDQREEAIACWDRALQIDTHCVAAWCAKGVSLATADRHKEAVACFDEALKIDPCLARVWSNKGDCLAALNRHEEAILCCDKALEFDPQDDAAWYNKAVGLAALARHEEAIACFDKALSIDPVLATAWARKGNSLAALRRPEEAIVCYARAVRIDPRDAVAWYNKALREEACGRSEDAAKSYQQFIEVAPPERAELVAAAKKRIAELCGSVEA